VWNQDQAEDLARVVWGFRGQRGRISRGYGNPRGSSYYSRRPNSVSVGGEKYVFNSVENVVFNFSRRCMYLCIRGMLFLKLLAYIVVFLYEGSQSCIAVNCRHSCFFPWELGLLGYYLASPTFFPGLFVTFLYQSCASVKEYQLFSSSRAVFFWLCKKKFSNLVAFLVDCDKCDMETYTESCAKQTIFVIRQWFFIWWF
jgi:hypothetical protein